MVLNSIVIRVLTVLVLHQVRYSREKECLDTWVRVKVTTQNLEVVRVDADKNLLLIKGAVPGAKKALITVKETTKSGK